MLEKTIVLLILYLSIWFYDGPKLKQKNQKERIAYGVLMMCTIYLSIDYVFAAGWPNLNELIDMFLTDIATYIVESIKVSA